MPRQAYVAVSKDDGYSLGIANEQEHGYYPTNYPTVSTYEDASRWAADCNASMGIDPAAAAEIILSTF